MSEKLYYNWWDLFTCWQASLNPLLPWRSSRSNIPIILNNTPTLTTPPHLALTEHLPCACGFLLFTGACFLSSFSVLFSARAWPPPALYTLGGRRNYKEGGAGTFWRAYEEAEAPGAERNMCEGDYVLRRSRCDPNSEPRWLQTDTLSQISNFHQRTMNSNDGAIVLVNLKERLFSKVFSALLGDWEWPTVHGRTSMTRLLQQCRKHMLLLYPMISQQGRLVPDNWDSTQREVTFWRQNITENRNYERRPT